MNPLDHWCTPEIPKVSDYERRDIGWERKEPDSPEWHEEKARFERRQSEAHRQKKNKAL